MERPDAGPPSASSPADSVPSDVGPAPPDADVRGPRVVAVLDERDHRRAGDDPPRLALQPWTPRGAGATYVAWRVDDCGGHFGVFDAASGLLYLGEGTPAGRRWRPVVDVGPAATHLASSTPNLRPPVPRATAATASGPKRAPAPADATATGPARAVELGSWTRPAAATLQAWRPLNGGAAYVACHVDDPHERFSYHGWFGTLVDDTLRLGRRPAPAFVGVELGADTRERLAADVDEVRVSASRIAVRTVDSVVGVAGDED